jgi:hypothetical protein
MSSFYHPFSQDPSSFEPQFDSSSGPQFGMLQGALSAWDAGLCVVKSHIDGSKRPYCLQCQQ